MSFETSHNMIWQIFLQVTCTPPEPVCFVPGECQGSVDRVEEAESQEECLELCQSHSFCEWFTYHTVIKACVLFRSCDEINQECDVCVTGEDECQVKKSSKLFFWSLYIVRHPTVCGIFLKSGSIRQNGLLRGG